MKKILNKILEEINKPEPRLDYIRGLIEASVEEEETVSIDIPKRVFDAPKTATEVGLMDESSIMEAETKAFVAKHGMPKPQEE